MIIKENRRANQVISRLRDLFKKGKFNPRYLDINDTIQQVIGLICMDRVSKKIPVVAELDPDLPPIVADRIHLQQVLLNLMQNGFDSMAHIDPKARKLILRTEREGEKYVKVSVKDSGGGIEGEPNRLFEPFYTTKANGMGMGLPICRFIIEAHEGSLWASNNPDGGATFSFRLPVSKE
jgi:signal transduction histidine kinase